LKRGFEESEIVGLLFSSWSTLWSNSRLFLQITFLIKHGGEINKSSSIYRGFLVLREIKCLLKETGENRVFVRGWSRLILGLKVYKQKRRTFRNALINKKFNNNKVKETVQR